MTKQTMFKTFAKKWEMHETQVLTIYEILQETKGKYGKTARICLSFGVKITARQLKYFYRKVRLTEKHGTPEEIGRKNYVNLVEKRS